MAKVAVFTNNQNPERWLQFDEDTEVLIEYLPRPAAIELHKKVDKIVGRTASDRQLVWGQQLGEATVKGWRKKGDHNHPGFLMPDGSPIPFNDENRDMMMKCCREFSLFVNENAVDAQVFLEQQAKAEERVEQKND